MATEQNNKPSPDELLQKIYHEEAAAKTGKLKIFFGMCAGVGKTYYMLETAHRLKKERADVVIGLVETHKRSETQKLVSGLEAIPLKEIVYKDCCFFEMDVDAIIKRKPKIVLVDELAHSNVPGSRHNKRFQDVLEILDEGIDVYTTLNVQHIESRTETVKQITGIEIRETVPDLIIERADEIELIDITIDELLKRLNEGKVYTADISKTATQNFFREGNLNALREMALRITAEKVDKDLRNYRGQNKISTIWKSSNRVMAAISPSPYSADLIRFAKRLAASSDSQWIAVYIENNKKISEQNKNNLLKNFKLVEDLGGKLIIKQNLDIVQGIVDTAKENNISQILIGKNRLKHNVFFLKQNFLLKLLAASNDIDIYIYSGEKPESKLRDKIAANFKLSINSSLSKYLISTLIIGMVSIILYVYSNSLGLGYQIVSLIFLLIISIMPLFNFRLGPVLVSAVLSAVIWDYLFIPPTFTIQIKDPADVITCIAYFVVAAVSGSLSAKIKTQQDFLTLKEARTSELYNLSNSLYSAHTLKQVEEITIEKISSLFNSKCAFIVAAGDNLSKEVNKNSTFSVDDYEYSIAAYCFSSKIKCGRFTDTLPSAKATYYPLKSKNRVLGVVAIRTKDDERFNFEQEEFLNLYLSQIANAFETEYLANVNKQSLISIESEKLYKTLFDSVSHELKTPLTNILAAASSVDLERSDYDQINRRLINEISIAANRLSRLVENLLDMARLESGHLSPELSFGNLEDVINSAVKKLIESNKDIEFSISKKTPIEDSKFDFTLVEQAIINVLQNCSSYSNDKKIEINLIQDEHNIKIIISDRGKGIPEADLKKIFNKFYRINGSPAGGIGLGLSISKGFIETHKGSIEAENNPKGGVSFIIKIPKGL